MSPAIRRLMGVLLELVEALNRSESPPRLVADTPPRPPRGTAVIRVRGEVIEVSEDGTSWRVAEFVPRGFQRDDEGSYWKPLTAPADDPSWSARKADYLQRRLG